MKILLTLIAFVVSISSIFAKQNKSEHTDSALIVKSENSWAIALITRDKKVFNNLLDEDFFYTENEKMYSREEVIQSAMSVTDTVENAYNEDMQVHIKN